MQNLKTQLRTHFPAFYQTLFQIKETIFHTERPTFETVYNRRFEKNFSQKDAAFVIKELFKSKLGYYPDLENPQTFNEKLQWLKLNYQNPLMTICADKVKARDYFCEKIAQGEKHLVRQFGVYSAASEIDFETLPQTFVLKSNWGSGLQHIVKNKSKIDEEALKKEVDSWVDPKRNHYYAFLEPSYKDIDGKIVCEEFLDFEYKLEFFCFNGEPKFFWIVLNDKTPQVQANFYRLNFEKIPLAQHYPNFEQAISKPACFDEILEISKKLCGDFPFVRCDFYVTRDSWRFSEMTFFHWSGYALMEPAQYDLEFGKMLKLPQK